MFEKFVEGLKDKQAKKGPGPENYSKAAMTLGGHPDAEHETETMGGGPPADVDAQIKAVDDETSKMLADAKGSGALAPLYDIAKELGFTSEEVLKAAQKGSVAGGKLAGKTPAELAAMLKDEGMKQAVADDREGAEPNEPAESDDGMDFGSFIDSKKEK